MIEDLMTTENITQLGFPIFVCIWFMFRTEKIIKANTDAINELIKKLK